MQYLLVDHYDSFSYNVLHLMQEAQETGSTAECDITVVQPHEMSLTQALTFDHFVLSPGPGRPEEFPWTVSLIEHADRRQGIFGICLGMQALCLAAGGSLSGMKTVQHGIQTSLSGDRSHPLFQSISFPLKVGKYHSWIPHRDSLPGTLKVIAKDKDGYLMAVSHSRKPHWGVQFHPESIMTPRGIDMMKAFFECCGQATEVGKRNDIKR